MGYWEEKQKYEKGIEKQSLREKLIAQGTTGLIINCSHCGNLLKNRGVGIVCKNFHWRPHLLCDKCAKKCKKCERYFCIKHMDNHKCLK